MAGIADSRDCLTLAFVPAAGGTYFVRVADIAAGSRAEFAYWLEVQ